jgi:hypothetical protein
MHTRTRTRKTAKPATRRKARRPVAATERMNRRTRATKGTPDPQAWRASVDWAMAGKKAAATRRRNLAAGKGTTAKATKPKPKPKAPVIAEDHTPS